MSTRPARRLDATGTLCPLPVLLASREIARMAAGERLEVVGDDPVMRLDIAAWCARTGHRLLEMREADGRITCLIEKTGEG